MRRLKIVTFVGTRPEIIRLSRLIPLLDMHTEHVLVHTSQNFAANLNEVFFTGMKIRQPDYVFPALTEDSRSTFLSMLFLETQELIEKIQPDGAVILGDTNSALASIVCEKMGIPVFHLEAGNRSFDSRVPEELNRKVVDHTATFNLAYTEMARRNLLREGVHPNQIAVTGSPMGEIMDYHHSEIAMSDVLEKNQLSPGEYFVLSAHRQETVNNDSLLSILFSAVERIAEDRGLRCIVSTHPRTLERLTKLPYTPGPLVHLSEPFSFFDYIRLQTSAAFVLSDSGTISEESSILGIPAVTIRDSIERQEAVESGVLTLSGVNHDDIESRIEFALSLSTHVSHPEYQSKDFSRRVMAFILSKLRLR